MVSDKVGGLRVPRYVQRIISDKKGDPKSLFKIINSLLGKEKENPFPPHDSIPELVQDFNDLFITKIERIRAQLDASAVSDLSFNLPIPQPPDQLLSEFAEIKVDDMHKLLKSMSIKSCDLDPVPARLLRSCMDTLAPIITRIVNLILSSGSMPKALKEALVIPLIKKITLELIFPSYRPVSNLAFLGKITEKVAAA